MVHCFIVRRIKIQSQFFEKWFNILSNGGAVFLEERRVSFREDLGKHEREALCLRGCSSRKIQSSFQKDLQEDVEECLMETRYILILRMHYGSILYFQQTRHFVSSASSLWTQHVVIMEALPTRIPVPYSSARQLIMHNQNQVALIKFGSFSNVTLNAVSKSIIAQKATAQTARFSKLSAWFFPDRYWIILPPEGLEISD